MTSSTSVNLPGRRRAGRTASQQSPSFRPSAVFDRAASRSHDPASPGWRRAAIRAAFSRHRRLRRSRRRRRRYRNRRRANPPSLQPPPSPLPATTATCRRWRTRTTNAMAAEHRSQPTTSDPPSRCAQYHGGRRVCCDNADAPPTILVTRAARGCWCAGIANSAFAQPSSARWRVTPERRFVLDLARELCTRWLRAST